MDEARVRFLVRTPGWEAWQALPVEHAELLEQASAEYRDDRLVAAFVLESVCADLREKARTAREAAAVAVAAAGPQTKSYEVVGEWKEEYAQPGQSAEDAQVATLESQAGSYCARAATLRLEVQREKRLRPRSVVVLPEQVTG